MTCSARKSSVSNLRTSTVASATGFSRSKLRESKISTGTQQKKHSLTECYSHHTIDHILKWMVSLTCCCCESDHLFLFVCFAFDRFLNRILEQADIRLKQDKRATYNGILPPNYITKSAEWRRALEHGEKI